MKDLHVSVRDKVASYSERDGKVVCGNTDYQIVFTFDSEWDAYPEKTARFIWNGKYIDVPFTGNICTMPMVYDTFTCLIGVYVKDFETTTSARIECLKSILCVDSVRDNESDKIYADEAEISANEAKGSAETATNAAQQAGNFAVRAEQAAETAEEVVASAVNKLKIPTVTAEDNGKILTVVDGEWEKSNPPTELPEVSETDSGKVLTVKGGQWSATEPPSGLPDVTNADNGKYLGIQNGQWKVIGQMEPDPDTLLPYVKQEDNGKVLSVVNGRWTAAEAPESGGGGFTIPVHDLSAMGLPAIEVGNMNGVFVEADTTQLMQDLAGGVVTLKMNMTMNGETIGAVKTCGGIVLNEAGMATITNIDSLGEMMVYSTIIMQNGFIGALAYQLDSMITSMIDAYMEDALGGDY